MRRLVFTLATAIALSGCSSKPVYDYKTIDKSVDARMATTEGRNQVMKEMTDSGWELVDPKRADRSIQVWRRAR
jgi:uncharacterized protein YceK